MGERRQVKMGFRFRARLVPQVTRLWTGTSFPHRIVEADPEFLFALSCPASHRERPVPVPAPNAHILFFFFWFTNLAKECLSTEKAGLCVCASFLVMMMVGFFLLYTHTYTHAVTQFRGSHTIVPLLCASSVKFCLQAFASSAWHRTHSDSQKEKKQAGRCWSKRRGILKRKHMVSASHGR